MQTGPMEPSMPADVNRALMLDGNAVAGLLEEVFSHDMTTSLAECASCGKQGQMGGVLAFTAGPGVVLRCPCCENVLMRIVRAPDAIYLDARGIVFLRISSRGH